MTEPVRRGQPRTFTDEQNAALHEALRRLKEQRACSQAALGKLLGIGQQSVGHLLRSTDAGFSNATAQRLATALGYASAESFFRSRAAASRKSA